MVRTNTASAKSIPSMSVREIVDRLVAIRDELVIDKTLPAFVAVSIWELVRDLEVTAAPPISGGCDECRDDHDFECIDPEFFSGDWPAYPTEELDGYTWEPTPLDVLAHDVEEEAISFAPTPATVELRGYTPGVGDWSELRKPFEPTAEDWADFAAWSESQSHITERDAIAAGLAV